MSAFSQRRRRILSVLSVRAANCSAPCWSGRSCLRENCPERRRRSAVSTGLWSWLWWTWIQFRCFHSSGINLAVHQTTVWLESPDQGWKKKPKHIIKYDCVCLSGCFPAQEGSVLKTSTAYSCDTATTAVWRCCSSTSAMNFTESRWVDWKEMVPNPNHTKNQTIRLKNTTFKPSSTQVPLDH